ncbi:MAG: hypothetical protein EXQ95_12705 [Alphaproteobacteria bacterium]|nr:hypothetical protein [Alphaproteobacteria bacterium]
MPASPIRGGCATRSFAAAGSTRPMRGPDRPKARRVARGGSWNDNSQNLRSANRNRNEPDHRNNKVGFRAASTLARRNRPGEPTSVQGRS